MPQFQNPNHIPCDLGVLVSNFNTVIQVISDFISLWEINKNLLMQIRINCTLINVLLKHIHRSHLHIKSHTVDSILNTNSGTHLFINKTMSETLPCELSGNTDRDFDNKKYGYDYILSPTTTHILNVMQNDIVETLNLLLPLHNNVSITYDIYKENNSKQYPDCPTTLIGQLIKELLTGNPCTRNYCSREIYGHTFYIDPNDQDKPTVLTEIENSLDGWAPPSKIMTWDQYIICANGRTHIIGTPPDECNYICARLKSEYIHNMDIDGNGIIYGHDFYLEDSEFKCYCLTALESDVEWKSNLKSITWNDFCSTFPNNNPDDRKEVNNE